MTKARIWKHYGNLEKAAEEMEKARKIDEKDRHINSKAAKYQLRNNENDKALDNMSKFTRNETVGGALGDLHEMQCVWYLTEDGESYLRQRKLGLALKRFHAVFNIFDVWQEDQFDFHSFSLRKGMIRAYVDMVRWEDRLREHPFYARIALSAIKAYLLLHDQPDLAYGPLPVNGGDEADEAERKKALKKAKKEQQRLEKAEAEKREAIRKAAANPKSTEGEVKKEDPDPLGNKLVQTQEPLKDALKFLTPLLEYCPQDIEAQCLGFEVHLRRGTFELFPQQYTMILTDLPGKYALALKCLSAAHSIDASNPTLHVQLLRFRQALNKLSEPLAPQVAEVVDSEFEALLPKSQKLDEWNASFLSENKDSVPHKLAYLTCQQLLTPESKPETEKELASTLDASIVSLETALAGLDLLGEWGSNQAAKTAYAEKASSKWPESTLFRIA
jgi:peptide alpha-N-acetyltransferase